MSTQSRSLVSAIPERIRKIAAQFANDDGSTTIRPVHVFLALCAYATEPRLREQDEVFTIPKKWHVAWEDPDSSETPDGQLPYEESLFPSLETYLRLRTLERRRQQPNDLHALFYALVTSEDPEIPGYLSVTPLSLREGLYDWIISVSGLGSGDVIGANEILMLGESIYVFLVRVELLDQMWTFMESPGFDADNTYSGSVL